MQVSRFLRRATDGYAHWCPGCREMHLIADRWSFDGNLDAPTFNPSVHIVGKRYSAERKELVDMCCHYLLHAGQLQFCGDSTHALAGQTVALPELPSHARDKRQETSDAQ